LSIFNNKIVKIAVSVSFVVHQSQKNGVLVVVWMEVVPNYFYVLFFLRQLFSFDPSETSKDLVQVLGIIIQHFE